MEALKGLDTAHALTLLSFLYPIVSNGSKENNCYWFPRLILSFQVPAMEQVARTGQGEETEVPDQTTGGSPPSAGAQAVVQSVVQLIRDVREGQPAPPG